MKTDKHLFKIFQACPNWVYLLASLDDPGPCTMRSETVKELERRIDNVVEPVDPAGKLTVVEVQFHEDPTIYTRTVAEMVALQEAHAMREVQGIIFFRRRGLDPETKPWINVVHRYYLRDVIDQLAGRQPDHPLVALFQPVLLTNPDAVEERAADCYRIIKNSELISDQVRDALLAVFVSWLEQRLIDKGKEEIEKMLLGELPDLEETQSGKDLIRIGERRGEERGEKRTICRFLERRLGALPAKLLQKIDSLDERRTLSMIDALDGLNSTDSVQRWLDEA